MYEIWREQLKPSEMQKRQLNLAVPIRQNLSDLSGRMLVRVWGLVILPCRVGLGIGFLSLLGLSSFRR